MSKKLLMTLKYFLLPLLVAIYFPLLNYANNVELLNISSLLPLLGLSILVALGAYIVTSLIFRQQSYKTSLVTVIILILFNSYGNFYNIVKSQNIIDITHVYFLPLFLLVGITIIFIVSRLKKDNPNNIWRIFIIISVFLLAFNIIRIAPAEIRKLTRQNKVHSPVAVGEDIKKDRPDIYFIIFDEFVGFEAMREYWENPDVDLMVSFLQENGFFVAEESYASNRLGDTLHQIAIRLNYEDYPVDSDKETLYEAIVDNQVMRLLKENGYQTVTFDETSGQFGYPARGSIYADVNYEDDPRVDTYDKAIVFDAFGRLVTDNSILSAISNFDSIAYAGLEEHKNMIFFTVNELGNLQGDTPLFAYVHLLLPHSPFMFDENGHYIDQEFHTNWDYYLGNYNFSMKMLQQIVDNILASYGPEDQPVIILQSDHGARNSSSSTDVDSLLVDYPEEFKALILNAMYLPNCPDSPLTQDMDPINTFPIIFNCYFGAEIPLK